MMAVARRIDVAEVPGGYRVSLHWLLGLYADHGAAWEGKADEVLKEVIAEAKTRATAAERPN